MKLLKKTRLCIYLNEKDLQNLQNLSKKKKLNNSALIRKLLASNKFVDIIDNINDYNKINKEILFQLTKIGININQISLNLKLRNSSKEENKAKFENYNAELSELLKAYKENKNLNMIDIGVNRIKGFKNEA